MENVIFILASLSFILFGLFLSVVICCVVSKEIRNQFIADWRKE